MISALTIVAAAGLVLANVRRLSLGLGGVVWWPPLVALAGVVAVDFLRRRFVDTNGDVAALVVPLAAATLLVPLDLAWGCLLSVFVVAFCATGLLTNQFHQWAHMLSPPAPVRWLQKRHLILGPQEHQRHHAPPHAAYYCITTGWCNRVLEATRFFARLERAITTTHGGAAAPG